MASSPRNTFLGNLSQWAYDVPYATQWALQIAPNAGTSTLLGSLQYYTTIDTSSFQLDSNVQSKLTNSSVMGESDNLGIHFAQNVSLPQDGFTPGRVGIEDSGGYLKGVTGGDRMSIGEKTVTIEFLETNLDFIDGIIRPWVIAAAYTGLIARSDTPSIKCNLMVVQYTKGASRPVRKMHQFADCVPYDVAGSTIDYESEKIFKRSVKWIYNTYTYKLMDYTGQ